MSIHSDTELPNNLEQFTVTMNAGNVLTSPVVPEEHGETPIVGESESAPDAGAMIAVILRASHRLRSALSDHFAEFGLTDIRFEVLQTLRNAEPNGCTQANLADGLSQSESSICMLVKRMRDSELLYRLKSRTDQRKWELKLTEKGRQLLEHAEGEHQKRMAELSATFSPEELTQLTELMQKLVSELEQPATTTQSTPDDEIHPMGERVNDRLQQHRPAA
jgi:MarR family transcriptional regulator, lower aerobic nicotinate degradation pathway regulator